MRIRLLKSRTRTSSAEASQGVPTQIQNTSFCAVPDWLNPNPQYPFDAAAITYGLVSEPSSSFEQILLDTVCSHFELPKQSGRKFVDLLLEKLTSIRQNTLPQNYQANLIGYLRDATPSQHVPIFRSFLLSETAHLPFCELIISLLQNFTHRYDHTVTPSNSVTFLCAVTCAFHFQHLTNSSPEHAIQQINQLIETSSRSHSNLQSLNEIQYTAKDSFHILIEFHETLLKHLTNEGTPLATLLCQDHPCAIYLWLFFNFSCTGNLNIVNAMAAIIQFSRQCTSTFAISPNVAASFALQLLAPQEPRTVDLDTLNLTIEKSVNLFHIVLPKDSVLALEIRELFRQPNFSSVFATFIKNLILRNEIIVLKKTMLVTTEQIIFEEGTDLFINYFRLYVEFFKQFKQYYSIFEFSILSSHLLCRIRLTETSTIEQIQAFLLTLHQTVLSCRGLINGAYPTAFKIVLRLIDLQIEREISLVFCSNMLNIYREVISDEYIQRVKLTSLGDFIPTNQEAIEITAQLLFHLSYRPIYNFLNNKSIPYIPSWSLSNGEFIAMRIAQMKNLFKYILDLTLNGVGLYLSPKLFILFACRLLKEAGIANLTDAHLSETFECIQDILKRSCEATLYGNPELLHVLSFSFNILFLIYPYGLPNLHTNTLHITRKELAEILCESTRTAKLFKGWLNCTIEEAFALVAALIKQNELISLHELQSIFVILINYFLDVDCESRETFMTYLRKYPSIELMADFLRKILPKQPLSEDNVDTTTQIKQAICSLQT